MDDDEGTAGGGRDGSRRAARAGEASLVLVAQLQAQRRAFERHRAALEESLRVARTTTADLAGRRARLPGPRGSEGGALGQRVGGDQWAGCLEARLQEAAVREVWVEQQERRRLAEELQADLGQRLSLLALGLRSLEDEVGSADARRLQELRSLASDTIRRLASLGLRMSPTVLYDVGPVAAARWLAEDLMRCGQLEVHLGPTAEIPELGERARTIVYRTLRELLDNVARHAGTGEAWVRLAGEGGWVRLEVEDAGAGFEPAAELSGYGLLRLRAGVRSLGGIVEVASTPGRGTRVRVELPIKPEDEAT